MRSTIGSYWDAAAGRPAGFDLWRVVLALSVVLWHAIIIAHGVSMDQWFQAGPWRPAIFAIVPAFFALSGFLVAGSLERNNLVSFLTLRAMRIFPALGAEVLISAFVLGAIFTTLPLGQYFRSPGLYAYFLNMIGDIHYFLPGVFKDVPLKGVVNEQLWPIPYELDCYIALAVLSLLGVARRPALLLALTAGANLLLLAYLAVRQGFGQTGEVASGRFLIFCFLYGVIFYQQRGRILLSVPLLLVSLAICIASVYVSTAIYLAPLPLAYVTVYFGVQRFKLPGLQMAANYSYPVYLYGFPIQQAVCSVFPDHRVWYFNFLVAGAITIGVGALSWHFLESKISARRKPILNFVNLIAGRLAEPPALFIRPVRALFTRGGAVKAPLRGSESSESTP